MTEFHIFLDGQLFVPKEIWHQDHQRCEQAGIPVDILFRPKCQIALEQYRLTVANGVRFARLTFDKGYDQNGGFMEESDCLVQNYVIEVPVDFIAWTQQPDVLYRQHSRYKTLGRRKTYPRLDVKTIPGWKSGISRATRQRCGLASERIIILKTVVKERWSGW